MTQHKQRGGFEIKRALTDGGAFSKVGYRNLLEIIQE